MKLFSIVTVGIVCLQGLAVTLCAQTYMATSMNASAPLNGPVTPARAADFLNSIGTNLHCDYTTEPYVTQYSSMRSLLGASGIRNVRVSSPNPFCVATVQDLYQSFRIKTNYLVLPYDGLGVDENFWASTNAQYLAPFLKNVVGTGPIASVEITNEPDVFYNYYRWHPGDTKSLENSSTSANGWGLYGPAISAEAYKVMKADPALAKIPVYGPALGYFYQGFAANSMKGAVDYGNMHPYPYGGNTWAFGATYDDIQLYFWQSDQPTVNIDEYPYVFAGYQPAFGAATPMVATETGYYTGTAFQSVSLKTQAKYIPRLLAEYFRHGIVKTYLYDFVDDGTDLANVENNYGLLTNSLEPKPAYTALKSMLDLLSDTDVDFTPQALAYTLSVQANGAFNRTNYVHDLLLQKANGVYYLLLWHEISSATDEGTRTTNIDLSPPALTTTVHLPTDVTSACLVSYDNDWNLNAAPLAISSGDVTVKASDEISVIEFSTRPHAELAPGCILIQTPVTLAWPTPAAITYGTALSAAQLNATASTAGSFVYNPPGGTLLAAGDHLLKATFTPLNQGAAVSSTVLLTVNAQATRATLLPSTTSMLTLADLTATGIVSAVSTGTPSGVVQLLDGDTNLGTASLVSGSVGFVAKSLTAGVHAFRLVYAGDADYLGSSSSAVVNVAKQPTAATVTVGTSLPLAAGQPVTLTTSVTSSLGGVPTGTLQIRESSRLLGTVVLANGTARFTTNALAPGAHSLTMLYAGDPNYLATSATTVLTINALDFTFAAVGVTNQTIGSGASASFTFDLSPSIGTYPSAVSFTVTGLPPAVKHTITPSSVASSDGTQKVTLTVQAPALIGSSTVPHEMAPVLFATLLLPFAATARCRNKVPKLLFAFLLLTGMTSLAGLTACAREGGYLLQPFVVHVAATSGSIQHTSAVTLNIQ